VDVEDSQVDGGVFDRGTVGLNWWATRRWKIGGESGASNRRATPKWKPS
jgi:hypothetical protein